MTQQTSTRTKMPRLCFSMSEIKAHLESVRQYLVKIRIGGAQCAKAILPCMCLDKIDRTMDVSVQLSITILIFLAWQEMIQNF